MFGSFHQGSLYQVVPSDTGGMYQSNRGLVRMVHTGLSLYPLVSYVGISVWFNTYRTDDRSVHRYGPIRRTMVFISNYFVRSRVWPAIRKDIPKQWAEILFILLLLNNIFLAHSVLSNVPKNWPFLPCVCIDIMAFFLCFEPAMAITCWYL